MPVWRAMLPILRDGLKELAVASVASNGTTVAMRRKSSFSVQRLNSQVQVNLSSKTKILMLVIDIKSDCELAKDH